MDGGRKGGLAYISNGVDEGQVGQGPVDALKKHLLSGTD